MKALQFLLRSHRLLALLLGFLTLQTVPSNGQVTLEQITNGLVDFYPLDSIYGMTTLDLVDRRDMTLVNMTSNNIVPANHPGIGGGSNCFDFNQSGGPTLIFYHTTGQNPLDGSGDFLPFINQRGATMNFWVKATLTNVSSEVRVMGECANDGDNQPFFSISARQNDNYEANYFLRDDFAGFATDPNGIQCMQLDDSTYQLPCVGYYYNQGTNNTSTNHPVLDGNWHMLTTTIDTNGDFHVFVDGVYDPGLQNGGPFTDHEGNLAVGPPLPVTNVYYTTNLYPLVNPPSSNPPPNGYVRWMMKLNETADTTFGGYIRNGSQTGGLPEEISDIAFWNRVLSQDEIMFVMTNGIPDCVSINCSQCHPSITSFSATPSTVHPGESVTLQWQIQAVTSEPIVSLLLSPAIGEVTNATDYITGNGSTNLPVFTNTTFSLTLTNLNNCGYLQAEFPASASVIVVPLVFTTKSYLPSDPGNAGNPSFTVTWNSVSNYTYTVQRKFDLTDPTWTTLTSGLPSGGNSTSFTDYTLGSSGTAFYRVTWP
jgi:hypothetical protein